MMERDAANRGRAAQAIKGRGPAKRARDQSDSEGYDEPSGDEDYEEQPRARNPPPKQARVGAADRPAPRPRAPAVPQVAPAAAAAAGGAAAAAAAAAGPRPVAAPARRVMAEQDVEIMIHNVMKLASENKITTKNTWSFDLIDHMTDMVVAEGTNTNFQKASVTLDAGVKIYCSRVDSVHHEAFKLLGGMNRTGAHEKGKEGEEGEDEEGAEGEGQEGGEGAAAAKKRKRRAAANTNPESTLEDPEALNAKKFDLAFAVDPLFKKTSAQFDAGGARGLLLNNLGVFDGCYVVFDSLEVPGARVKGPDAEGRAPQDAPRIDLAGLPDGLDVSDLTADCLQGLRLARGLDLVEEQLGQAGPDAAAKEGVRALVGSAAEEADELAQMVGRVAYRQAQRAARARAAELALAAAPPAPAPHEPAAAPAAQAAAEADAEAGPGPAPADADAAMDDGAAAAPAAAADEGGAAFEDAFYEGGGGDDGDDDGGYGEYQYGADVPLGEGGSEDRGAEGGSPLGGEGEAEGLAGVDEDAVAWLAGHYQRQKHGWAGAKHWKYGQKKAQEGEEAPPARKKGAKAKAKAPLELEGAPRVDRRLLALAKKEKIRKKTVPGQPLDTLLPRDYQIQVDDLISCFVRPERILGRKGDGGGAAREDADGAAEPDHHIELVPLAPAPDFGFGGQDDDDDGFGDGEGMGDYGGAEGGDYDMYGDLAGGAEHRMAALEAEAEVAAPPAPGTIQLVQAPRRVQQVSVNYSRVSKQVDVKQLKEELLGGLTDTAPRRPVKGPDGGAAPAVRFSELLRTIPQDTRAGRLEDLSPHLGFICLLHLANEKGLAIRGNDRLNELTVTNLPPPTQQ